MWALAVLITVLILFGFVRLARPVNVAAAQIERLLSDARRVVALVALYFVVTTPFVNSVLISTTGYQSTFYSDLGLLQALVANEFLLSYVMKVEVLWLYQGITAISLLAVVLRYRVQLFTWCSVLLLTCFLALLLKISLKGHLMLQLIFLLLVFGLLDLIRRWNHSQSESQQAQQSLMVVLAAVSIPYVYAATNKLVVLGLDWFSAANIKGYLLIGSYLQYESWQWQASLLIAQMPESVLYGVGFLVLVCQMASILIVRSVRARLLVPTCLILVHLGIYAFMGFLFYDLIVVQGLILVLVWHEYRTPPVVREKIIFSKYYIALLFVIFLIPTYLVLAQKTMFPFTNWEVYAYPSRHYLQDDFVLTNIVVTDGDGNRDDFSVGKFESLIELYAYPRARCYWRPNVLYNWDDCAIFFSRAAEYLEATGYGGVSQIELHFHTIIETDISSSFTISESSNSMVLYEIDQ